MVTPHLARRQPALLITRRTSAGAAGRVGTVPQVPRAPQALSRCKLCACCPSPRSALPSAAAGLPPLSAAEGHVHIPRPPPASTRALRQAAPLPPFLPFSLFRGRLSSWKNLFLIQTSPPPGSHCDLLRLSLRTCADFQEGTSGSGPSGDVRLSPPREGLPEGRDSGLLNLTRRSPSQTVTVITGPAKLQRREEPADISSSQRVRCLPPLTRSISPTQGEGRAQLFLDF